MIHYQGDKAKSYAEGDNLCLWFYKDYLIIGCRKKGGATWHYRVVTPYNGVFHLVDSWRERSDGRSVFKFKLAAVEGEEDFSVPVPKQSKARRIIPTSVKLEVWKRDGGKCSKCGATEDLHFDHIIPWSKGGSSSTPDNIQLLCGKHNLEKHDRIE